MIRSEHKMHKKFIGLMVITSLFLTVVLSCFASAGHIENSELFPDEYVIFYEESGSKIFMGTTGPISPFLRIAEIKLISGNSSQIQKIERLLNNRVLQLFLTEAHIMVRDLTFSVTYNRTIPSLPLFERFSYSTLVGKVNGTLYNESHTVIVTELDGIFLLSKKKFVPNYGLRGRKFVYPAFFGFEGYCKEITIL